MRLNIELLLKIRVPLVRKVLFMITGRRVPIDDSQADLQILSESNRLRRQGNIREYVDVQTELDWVKMCLSSKYPRLEK